MTPRDEPERFSQYRLPRGRHRLPRELVAENQRWRLIGAAGELLAETGYARLTSKAVAQRAGVSSSAFYEHFEHLDACLLAAHEMAADAFAELVLAACTGEGEFVQRLRLAIDAGFEYLLAEPGSTALLGFEVAAGAAAVAAGRERLLFRLSGLLCGARRLRIETANELPPRIELHLLAGAFALASARLAEAGAGCRQGFAAELAQVLELPYTRPSAS